MSHIIVADWKVLIAQNQIVEGKILDNAWVQVSDLKLEACRVYGLTPSGYWLEVFALREGSKSCRCKQHTRTHTACSMTAR